LAQDFWHKSYVNQITDDFVSFPNIRYHVNNDRFI